MKVIQTKNDIEQLKIFNRLPIELIQVIENDFLILYEAEGIEEDLYKFCLHFHQALFLLEKGDKVLEILDVPSLHIEYVERNKLGKIDYFRIARRTEHEFQLFYTLAKTHDKEAESWLDEHAEWNDGSGDFNV